MNYTEIQQEVIKKYRIEICDGTLCDGTKCPHAWRRTHSCTMARKIYKWDFKNSIRATFDLFHEIGHQETHTKKMRRCESEYAATVWAIDRMREYGLVDKINEKTRKLYQDYILRERDRGARRGGKNYPTKAELMLQW
jgi:hypothetical protein